MQINVTVGLDQLHELPMNLKLQIQAALKIPEQQTQLQQPQSFGGYAAQPAPQQILGQFVQQPQQQPAFQTQPQQPVYQPPAHQGPAPILNGNTMVFPAARNGLDQVSAAKDVVTGQTAAIPPVNQAPYIPPISNTPVTVGPVATSGPPAATQHNGITAANVRGHMIKLHNDQTRPGLANAALQRSGLHQLAALNDQNAHMLWQAICEVGGQ